MRIPNSLEANKDAYQKALNELGVDSEDVGSALRRILIARDRLALELESVHVTPEMYESVAKLDKQLEEIWISIQGTIDGPTFERWRAVKPPPKSAWWWFLDKRTSDSAAQKWSAFRMLIIAGLLSISGSVSLDILERWLSGGGDWLRLVSTIIETPLKVLGAVFGVFALGTLTDNGQKWVNSLLNKIGLGNSAGSIRRLIIALVISCLIVLFRLTLPTIAKSYIKVGAEHLSQNNQSTALAAYKRAISLDPDNARGHYGAGIVQENFHNYDEAINEYRMAILLESGFLEAHNNLARLYILRGKDKDFENALQILNDALNLPALSQDVRYVLMKNRGWANYELKHFRQAEADLKEAVRIDQSRADRKDDSMDRGAPHCLLGYVLEAQQRDALEEWQDCVRYSSGEEDLKAEWISMAKNRLTEGSRK
jgi:Tfp pilus assembly protein PilF